MKGLVEERSSVFLASMGSVTVFLGLAAMKSKTGNRLMVFIYIVLTWMSYMIAHREIEACFIHRRNTRKGESGAKIKDLLMNKVFQLGALLFVSGMIIGSFGVGRQAIHLTVLGSLLFNTGYITSHYSATGKLL
jgi:hypothetical protein